MATDFACDQRRGLERQRETLAGPPGPVKRGVDGYAISPRWSRHLIVEADTDNPNNDVDSVLLRNGTMVLRESDPLPGPAGIGLGGFDSNSLNNAGQIGFNSFRDGAATGMDSGIHAYLDTTAVPLVSTVLVLLEGADAPGFPASTPVLGYFDVKLNDTGTLMAMTSINAAAIPSSVDRVLYLLTTDASTGGVSTSTIVAADGDILTGQASALTDFGTGPHETALNNAGDLLFAVDIPGADAIYHYDGTFTELAQEGDASPVMLRSWATLTSTSLDLNNSGQHVYRGSLDGDTTTNCLLVKDGMKFMQEGDTIPAIGGVFTFESFGTDPLLIDVGGNVVWYGEWSDPDGDIDSGLFRNEALLIQEGVTTVAGLGIIDTLRGVTDGFALSDSGRYLVIEATLASGVEGAFLIELPIFPDGFESGDTGAWTTTVPYLP